jgi:hypothetical protein
MDPSSQNQQNPEPAIDPSRVSIAPAGLPRDEASRFTPMNSAAPAPVENPSLQIPHNDTPPAAPTPTIQALEPVELPPLPQPPQTVQPTVPPPSIQTRPIMAPPVPVGSTMPVAPQVGGPATPVAAPVPKSNPNSTQNTLQIAEIRDGIVIMSDGSFRSVVMVKSINFDLMSPQEQEAVEYSYQAFLNSLYFPVQIFIRSQKVDLQPYIEKLDKIRTEHDNMLLALLMEDYIAYIDGLSQQTNIMDKKFYIIIPFYPVIDAQRALTQSKNFFTGVANLFNSKEQHVVVNEQDLENAKSELRNRVQAVLSGLLQAQIQGLPLDTQELIELYYDTYNPDTATRQQLKNFNNLTADIITKGQGAAPQAHLQRELQ